MLKRADHLKAIGLGTEDVDRLLDAFVALSEPITSHFRIRPAIRYPDDELFAELAINGQADALVSFNLGDYRPANPRFPCMTIPVCRPGEILRRLSWRPSATSRSAFLRP